MGVLASCGHGLLVGAKLPSPPINFTNELGLSKSMHAKMFWCLLPLFLWVEVSWVFGMVLSRWWYPCVGSIDRWVSP